MYQRWHVVTRNCEGATVNVLVNQRHFVADYLDAHFDAKWMQKQKV